MAMNSGSSGLRFFLRFLGVTGAFVAGGAGVFLAAFPDSPLRMAALGACLAGAALAVMAFVGELTKATNLFASRRGAVGLGVFVQLALALVLLVGVNLFAFRTYKRFDLTWDKSFTLPIEVRRQLSQLRGETDVVVVQKGVGFGQRDDSSQDRYDLAAERKIVEKVRDLAELFQDLGPRFRVSVVDIKDEDYDKKLDQLRAERGDVLADAVKNAPENSVLFHADNKVQRLAYHDVYLLDKRASREANGGKGNLVLNFQGVEPFARKILNIEERKPRVTVAVVHPALSTTSPEHPLLTMNGVKKALEAQGFVCNDLLLRKQEGEGLSQDPSASTFDESRFEQIEEEVAALDEGIREVTKELALVNDELTLWRDNALDVVGKKYVYVMLENGQQGVILRKALQDIEARKIRHKTIPVDEDDRRNQVAMYSRELALFTRELADSKKERDALLAEKSKLNVEDLAERRRLSDVEAKMKRILADTDLLVIPRFTMHSIPAEQIISSKVHKLHADQIKAIKAYLRQGRPALFLLGPTNERREMPDFGGAGDDDTLEPMLAELGVRLPKQTILFNVEMKEFADRKIGLAFSPRETQVPPVKTDWQSGAGQLVKKTREDADRHPIRVSLAMTSRGVNDSDANRLSIRHPRPVYLVRDKNEKVAYDEAAVFLMATDDSWNESSPFPNEKREPPRFRPAKDDDPRKGTLEETRRGPFPIGVAFEKAPPPNWGEGSALKKTRIAVVGAGGVFVGGKLSAVREKLLLDMSNWLLGRDDLLAREASEWSYPRLALSDSAERGWHLGMLVGLPAIFLWFGVLVWILRHAR